MSPSHRFSIFHLRFACLCTYRSTDASVPRYVVCLCLHCLLCLTCISQLQLQGVRSNLSRNIPLSTDSTTVVLLSRAACVQWGRDCCVLESAVAAYRRRTYQPLQVVWHRLTVISSTKDRSSSEFCLSNKRVSIHS